VLKFLSQAHINEQNKNEELKSPLPSDSNLLKTLVSDLVPQCTHLQPYFVDAPVSHCINLMTKVHRVALYRKNFELFTTVSQSDVLRYLGVVINDVRTGKQYTQRYKRDILDLCETKLSKLNVFHTPISLQSTATIYDALELCIKCNYRVLSILNPNGQIIGDFCVDKLSSLQPYYDKTHQYTLQDWLTTINPIHSADVSCIDGDATYEQAILLMLSRKTHHLWAVDADIKPVFILTITDLFKVLEPIDLSSKESYDVELGQLWK
jgi:signal-transduction protein with cAMP-binding, CBS, and nucleotidyltransferase domain